MTRRLAFALLPLVLGCSSPPEPQPQPPEEPPPMRVIADYSGWAFERSVPDPTPFAIQDAEALAAFLARIPTTVPSKRQPAPKNDDALRAAPAPDFSQHMLVVSVRDSMYVGPQIVEVERAGDGVRVRVELPPLGDTIHAAAILELGRYHAVLVPRADGPLEGSVVEVPE